VNWSAIGALLLALAVILGAFGAHGLRGRLNADLMDVYRTAVLYHFLHALGLLLVPMLQKNGGLTLQGAGTVCWLLAAGILVFSGSLYLLAVTGMGALGAVTPIGGLAFIAAWVRLGWLLR
jgi:uncharacterized membrane protein YgdD (TMEM256/DUF423 family)